MLTSKSFTSFSNGVTQVADRPVTFRICLIVNTGTTIITFLMVFLIQNTQNRDAAAIQAKLDELIRASAV